MLNLTDIKDAYYRIKPFINKTYVLNSRTLNKKICSALKFILNVKIFKE